MRLKKILTTKLTKARPAKSKAKAKSLKNQKAFFRPPLLRYMLNREFEFIQELRDLVLKSSPSEKKEIFSRLQKLGKIKLAVTTGIYLNKENNEKIPTD